jgi:hypothetical protein
VLLSCLVFVPAGPRFGAFIPSEFPTGPLFTIVGAETASWCLNVDHDHSSAMYSYMPQELGTQFTWKTLTWYTPGWEMLRMVITGALLAVLNVRALVPKSYSGQSSWIQIQRSGFDSRCYQISWEVLSLEQGPLSLVSTTEELLERKYSGAGLENPDYGRTGSAVPTTRQPSIHRKLALNSPTSGGRSVGIVRSRTKATELELVMWPLYKMQWFEEHPNFIFSPHCLHWH